MAARQTPAWLLCVSIFLSLSCAQDECGLPDGIEAPKEVTIGGLMSAPSGDPQKTAAIRFAVDRINQDDCLLPETHLNLVMGKGAGDPTSGLREFLRIQDKYDPIGWTGFPLSSTSRTIALASPLSETPIVSGTSALADLSDEDIYPFFSRVIATTASQGIILADLCDSYGWDRVAIISVNDAWGASVVEQFTNRAVTYSIQTLSTATFPLKSAASTEEDYKAQIRSAIKKTISSGARIILLANLPAEAVAYWKIAMEEGLIGYPYTYLLPEGFHPLSIALAFEDDDLAEKFRQNMRGMINVQSQGVQPSPVTDAWVEAWMSADPDEYPGAGKELFATHKSLALYRDATYTLAHGIDRLIRRGIDPSDGMALLETIQQETDFVGLTGNVRLKPNGDRDATHDILNAQDFSFDLTIIGWATEEEFLLKEDAIFPDGTTHFPDAAEQIYVDWGDAEAIAMVVLFSLGLLVTLGCLIVMMSHRSTPIMNYSSPRFVVGMGVGMLIGLANVFVWTGRPSPEMCQTRPWLLTLNFAMIFGHLYAKAFRVLWVMKQRKKLQFQPIPDIHLFLCVFFYLLVFVIPCIVWTAAFPLDVVRSDENPDNDKVNIICNGENSEVFLGVLLGLGGLSLLIGVVVAFLNRKYHDFFSEATYIGYTMFTVGVTCCVVLPMLFILNDTPHGFYIVLMLGVFLGNGAVLVFMFFPKVFVIFTPEKNVVPLDASGALKTKRAATATHHAYGDRSLSKKSSRNDSSKKCDEDDNV